MIETSVVLVAFFIGLLFKQLGFMPLLGYLCAGFIASHFGLGDPALIAPIADFGVLLLLFTIGLKLKIKSLLAPQVWAVGGLHMLIVVPLTAIVIIGAGMIFPAINLGDHQAAWMLAFALSFSSTVFAVKVFDDRGESNSLHAFIAIGILVFQDVIAVIFLVLSSGKIPEIWAIAFLLLPLCRPLLYKLLEKAGHGELLALFGIAATLAGGYLFELANLKAGLGAIVFGALLANYDKSRELYKSLLNLKDVFLIGFFLQVGYNGFPSWEMVLVALVLSGLIFLRPMIYFALFLLFRLRGRTSLLCSLSLFNYSEFGLIVAALIASNGQLPAEWLTTIALAMALSFFIAAPFNSKVHALYARYYDKISTLERTELIKREQPVSLGDAAVVILGLGRVGSGAYKYFSQQFPNQIVGVEGSVKRCKLMQEKGINCVLGDGSDRDFWQRADLDKRDIIIVCLSNHSENVSVVNLLKSLGFKGQIGVIARFEDQQQELEKLGCIAFNLYAEAGYGFAEHVIGRLSAPS